MFNGAIAVCLMTAVVCAGAPVNSATDTHDPPAEATAFRKLGPPTLEELDRLFSPPKHDDEHADRPRETSKRQSDTTPDAALGPLEQMVASPDPVIRARAVEGLAALGDDSAIPYLLISLADQDAGVRDLAARSISTLPVDRLCDAVIAVLGWGDPMVAEGVNASLPQLRPTLESALIDRLRARTTPRVERMAAAYCLGRMGSSRAGEALASEVWGDDLTLALYCADALAVIDEPGLLREFLRMAQHPQVQMRVAAYQGLARIGGDEARHALTEAAAGRAEPDTAARKVAIRFLGYVGNEETVEFLMTLVRARAGLVRPATDALAILTGLPQGLEGERWQEWYEEVYLPSKGTQKTVQKPQGNAPLGFPQEGFPFQP